MSEKKKDDKPKKPGFTFGPFEQALAVVLVMGFAANPSIPWSILSPTQPTQTFPSPIAGQPNILSSSTSGISGIPFLTPPLIALILIAYIGYHLLQRQQYSIERTALLAKTAAKAASSSSSSSSSGGSSSKTGGSSSSSGGKAMSSSDIRSGGMPSSSSGGGSKTGDPAPKKVSSSSNSSSRGGGGGSSLRVKKNFFMTMQGPGRPALVPFRQGLKGKDGEEAGTMWWDNVPDDAAQLMAPPVDPSKAGPPKNPWMGDMIGKDIELLKLMKQKVEEEERYQKVVNLLQTLLGLLLCAVDMRLGVVFILFFLWRHYSSLQAGDAEAAKEEVEKEKKEIEKKLAEARKAGMDSTEMSGLKKQLTALG